MQSKETIIKRLVQLNLEAKMDDQTFIAAMRILHHPYKAPEQLGVSTMHFTWALDKIHEVNR